MACAIFYTHQTSGECAGVCECDHAHQMEKAGLMQFVVAVYKDWLNKYNAFQKLNYTFMKFLLSGFCSLIFLQSKSRKTKTLWTESAKQFWK